MQQGLPQTKSSECIQSRRNFMRKNWKWVSPVLVGIARCVFIVRKKMATVNYVRMFFLFFLECIRFVLSFVIGMLEKFDNCLGKFWEVINWSLFRNNFVELKKKYLDFNLFLKFFAQSIIVISRNSHPRINFF